MKRKRAVSLFSGLGGFDIALEAFDVEVVAGCDIEPFVAGLFEQRFGVPVIPDVAEVTADHPLLEGGIDIVCGGFPCQPVSLAGKGAAQEDDRWLWPEFARVIRELQPEYVFIENVPGLRKRGLVDVLEELCDMGYDAEWDGIPAAAVGAPHLRDRVWVVAYRTVDPERELWGPALGMFPEPLETAAHLRAGRMRAGEIWEVEPIAELAGVRAGVTLPTPVANDVKGDVIGHLRNKNGWDRAARTQITSLAVLARNGFEQPTDEQLDEAMRTAQETERAAENGWERVPTPNARDWKDTGAGRMGRGQLPEAVRNLELVPTPKATDAERGGRGDLLQVVRGNEYATGHYRQQLWPTPHGMSPDAEGHYDGHGNELSQAVRVVEGLSDSERSAAKAPMAPTPTARDGSSRAEQERRFYVLGEDNPTLLGFARTLEGTADHPTRHADHWPTPQASDGTGGRNEMGAIHREIETGELRRPSGSKVTIPLGSAVRAVEDGLWPTPKASPSGPDYARADREESGGDDLATAAARTQKGQLNPRWVEWLMGFPLGWTDPECANEDLEFWPWTVEPLPRVAEGVKLRRQRLTALGNALVWQVAAVVVGKALRG